MDRYHCRCIYRLISLLRYMIKVVSSYLRAKLPLPVHAPRQLLLHCSTTVRPVRIAHFPVGKASTPCSRPLPTSLWAKKMAAPGDHFISSL